VVQVGRSLGGVHPARGRGGGAHRALGRWQGGGRGVTQGHSAVEEALRWLAETCEGWGL
jgi:hypothetical protein